MKPGGKLAEVVTRAGGKGLAWLKVEEGKLTGGIEKFLGSGALASLPDLMEAKPGDLLLFVADEPMKVAGLLGGLRTHLAGQLGLLVGKEHDYRPLWVVDFPAFMHDDEANRWVANHHPFTAPRVEDLPLLGTDPGKVLARAYDLVINGYECGGGSIRIHSSAVQAEVFRVLGLEVDQAREKFGFLLDALQMGAPPHGGIALGLRLNSLECAGVGFCPAAACILKTYSAAAVSFFAAASAFTCAAGAFCSINLSRS